MEACSTVLDKQWILNTYFLLCPQICADKDLCNSDDYFGVGGCCSAEIIQIVSAFWLLFIIHSLTNLLCRITSIIEILNLSWILLEYINVLWIQEYMNRIVAEMFRDLDLTCSMFLPDLSKRDELSFWLIEKKFCWCSAWLKTQRTSLPSQ